MADRVDKGIFQSNKVRTVVFLCIIAIIVIVCCKIFVFADAERSNKIMEQFYAQDKNTVDCIYFGSSATQRGWVVPVAFHDEGVASYSLASGTQPFILTRYLMEEAEKTQDPKLFIVELRGICKDPDDLAWDVPVRRIIDNMKMSQTKRDAIKAVTEYSNKGDGTVDKTGMSYYFTLLKYHSRWNPSKQPKYGETEYYKGYALNPDVTFKVGDIDPRDYNDGYDEGTHPIDEAMEDVLIDLLDYCDTLDAKVLFVISPVEAYDLGMHKMNYARAIVEEHGYECLNFMPPESREALGLDDLTCYYNREHLNLYGSIKYTDYLSQYIKKNYDVPDRRGDPKYDSWEQEYDRLSDNLKGKYKDRYTSMMKKIEERESGAQ